MFRLGVPVMSVHAAYSVGLTADNKLAVTHPFECCIVKIVYGTDTYFVRYYVVNVIELNMIISVTDAVLDHVALF